MMNRLICLFLLVILVSACGKEAPEPVERIRAVKTILVAERATGQMRKFPGTVEPVDNSSISFEVSGLVREIRVDAGERFEAGQVLAVLDKKPFELNVESARAALSQAEALNTERRSAYNRQLRILAQDPGATSQQAVDQARAGFESTEENISYTRAQLNLALRDLENTELRAPFDGIVSAQHVEAFEEVRRGQRVFDVFVEGAMEATVAIPEIMIAEVYLGLKGEVRLPNREDVVYEAVISEVGSAATAANAFPVKATILEADQLVRPGMTAELTLPFAFEGETQSGYLIPLEAIAPGMSPDDRHVYVFDAESSTVRKTAVQAKGMVGNRVIVTAGIEPGDAIVIAGVPFLRDGQKVKLLNPAHGAATSDVTS